jgi:hypothetical protein
MYNFLVARGCISGPTQEYTRLAFCNPGLLDGTIDIRIE